MADIVNLNKVRKAKARTEKEQRAQHNRVLHGTPKALKDFGHANKDLLDKKLNARKLVRDLDGDGDDGTDGPGRT